MLKDGWNLVSLNRYKEVMENFDLVLYREQMNISTINSTLIPSPSTEWPHLSTMNVLAIIGINLGSVLLTWIALRVIWKPVTLESKPLDSIADNEEQAKLLPNKSEEKKISNLREIYEGEVGGDYSKEWTRTFDLVLIIILIGWLIFNILLTIFWAPTVWTLWIFWLKQLVLFVTTSLVTYLSGRLARHFNSVDDMGYIITNRQSPFKINYTRKLTFFGSFVLPLAFSHKIINYGIPTVVDLEWAYWTMNLQSAFWIKPIRERVKFFMVAFNGIDRPEDRPNTLLWITLGNLIPGQTLIVLFTYLYQATSVSNELVYIVVLVNVIGDSFAEPVGVYFGKHRYKTKGCCNATLYERSLEGSSCIFISSIIFLSIFWFTFKSSTQFWLAMIIFPISMTFAEALSPHTMDTPLLTAVGGLILFLIAHLNITWF